MGLGLFRTDYGDGEPYAWLANQSGHVLIGDRTAWAALFAAAAAGRTLSPWAAAALAVLAWAGAKELRDHRLGGPDREGARGWDWAADAWHYALGAVSMALMAAAAAGGHPLIGLAGALLPVPGQALALALRVRARRPARPPSA